MGAIVLAKNFSFVAASGQSVFGDWIPFDGEFQDANVHVHCQTFSPLGLSTGLRVIIETSYDTVEHVQAGSAVSVAFPGSADGSIMQDLASHVRVQFVNAEAVTIMAIVSVWLQPKSD